MKHLMMRKRSRWMFDGTDERIGEVPDNSVHIAVKQRTIRSRA